MARNEEKHYGRLNRLYLWKEREEYEKAHPKRPRLDLLDTPEEVQKWLPSIKRDIEFYLKKSQVTCYSEQQIEDCRQKVCNLEKEFKAFVRKVKQLTPETLAAIPWTSRPYKKRKIEPVEDCPKKEFKPIDTPILNEEKREEVATFEVVDLPLMNESLCFMTNKTQNENLLFSNLDNSQNTSENTNDKNQLSELNEKLSKDHSGLVSYDSSDSDG